MRELLLFSQSDAVVKQWEKLEENRVAVRSVEELQKRLDPSKVQIVLYDEDSLHYLEADIAQKIFAVAKSYLFILTGSPSFPEGLELLKLRISGYGNSYMHPGNLKVALDVIEQGQMWLYPEFMQRLIVDVTQKEEQHRASHDIRFDMLTDKEHEVADLVARGMSNKEVASHMGITERTVKAHLSNIYMKLEIGDRLTLALMMQK